MELTAKYGGCVQIANEATLEDCTITVTDNRTGTGTHQNCAVAVQYLGEVTINGGTYSAPHGVYAYNSGGFITITDGTFTGTTDVVRVDAVNWNYYYEDHYGEYDAKEHGPLCGVEISGGTFTGTLVLTDFASEYSFTGGTFSSDPSDYLGTGFEAVVNTADAALYDVIPAHKVYSGDATLELSDDFAASGYDGAIEVTGGTLIINGDGSVHALQDANHEGFAMAVWAHVSPDAKVIINGGNYTNEPDVWSSDQIHVDLIYASNGAQIEINGGTFKSVTPQWTLNCKDNSDSLITVKGGKFYQFDPSAANEINAPAGTTEITVPDGYKVVEVDDDWYEVRADGVYTVIFDANGGTCDTASALTNAQGMLTVLPTAARSGSYRFDGWYTAASGGTKVTSTSEITNDITLYAHWTYTGGSSSSGGSSGSSTEKNPDGSTTTTTTDKTTGAVTEVTKEKDGTTTTVETKKDGTVTETVKLSDGTTGTVVTDKSGNVTEAKAVVSSTAAKEAGKTGGAVTLPVEVPAAKTTGDAPAVEITVPQSAGSVKVEIPVEKVTPGSVAVIVKADGTEKIVSTSVTTESGVALTLGSNTTVKVIDNAKSFADVPVTNVFYNEICSMSAREIMVGRSEDTFDLHSSVTLNQVANVAGRIVGAVDVKDYKDGIVWGAENGLKTGNTDASRGDVLKALYMAAGSPVVEDTSILARFNDASAISADLTVAAAWATQNGILKGTTDGNANLSANVTRGQACALAGRTMGTLA